MTTEAQRIMPIQYLRGIAAMAVVLAHITSHQRPLVGEQSVVLPDVSGFWGVDIFFVISGFIIVYITRDIAPGFAASRNFFCKRLIRIVPAYWFFTLLIFFIEKWNIFGNAEASKVNVMMLLKSMFFMKPGFPLLFVGWTLTLEMFFYSIFALLMIFVKDSGRVVAVCILFVALALLPYLVDSEDRYFRFYTQTVLLEFVAGMIIAYRFRRNPSAKYSQFSLLVFLVGVGLMVASNVVFDMETLNRHRALLWGVPAALIVYGALRFQDFWGSRLASMLGSISYSLYLCHIMCAYISAKIALDWVLPGVSQGWVYLSLAMVSSLIVSVISYWFFEKYLDQKLRHMFCR